MLNSEILAANSIDELCSWNVFLFFEDFESTHDVIKNETRTWTHSIGTFSELLLNIGSHQNLTR